MDVVVWMFFGALIGWIGALLVADNNRYLSLTTIISGAIGAVLAGVITQIAIPIEVDGVTSASLLVSICGALIFTFISTFIFDKTSRK